MKFDKPTTEAILKDIEDGVPYKIAAESNGVAYITFISWAAYGKRDSEAGLDTKYTQFLRSLRQIEKNRIKKNLLNIESSDKSHKGSEWILERSFWQHFSQRASEIDINERLDRLESMKEEKNAKKRRKNNSKEEE